MAEPEKKETADEDNARPQFGNRFLTNKDNVFKHNAWDNVEWTIEQEQKAENTVRNQMEQKLDEPEAEKYLKNCNSYWDSFYGKHDNKFFKDRHWLFTEFPELLNNINETPSNEEESFRILEVGCGVGNTIFPLLKAHTNSNVQLYGCDYSDTAIEILKSHELYDNKKCSAFVHDISSRDAYPIEEESLDIIVAIFVLSALKKPDMPRAISQLYKLLKPGGVILFRDYGRHDMAQLRFKPNRCIDENFYSRGDGTLVYFFAQDDVKTLFSNAGFIEKQNIVDRRLQVNRSRQIKMYRVWIQAKYQKPKNSEF